MKSTLKMLFCCLRNQEEEDISPKRLRMTIVGDGTCGKTCLLHRFTNDEFFPLYVPTVFDVHTKHVSYQDQEVDVVMYDTAGQEDYDRLRPLSYYETDVMVICYALDNPDSLANVLLNWVTEVRYFCGNIPILLVGNKKDLRDRPGTATGAGSVGDIFRGGKSIFKHNDITSYSSMEVSQFGRKMVHTDPIEAAEAEGRLSRTSGVGDLSKSLASTRSSSDSLNVSIPTTMVKYEEGLAVARKVNAFGYYECSAKTGEGASAVFDAVVRAGMDTKGHTKSTGLFRFKKNKKRV